MTRLDRHMKKMHPEEMKQARLVTKQGIAECSFSSEDDLEDDFAKAKMEEIMAKL